MKASQKLKQRSLRKVQQAAKEIEALLQEGTVQDDSAKIRQRLDDMLEGDEYFVLVTREGLGIIHTNRLREGTLFNDEVGLRAARTNEPLAQMYPRNTGELLLDTSVPVQVRGENAYSLRLGVVVPALSYGWKLVAAFVMPVCFATVGLWLAQSPWTKGAVAAIALMLAACIGLLTHRNFRHNWRDWMRVTKAISSGKLKVRVQTARRDEWGQMSFEINKMLIGIHGILTELRQTSHATKEISTKQEAMVQELLSASEQLSAGLQQVHGGAVEQASLVEDTEAVLKKITALIRKAGSELKETSTLTQEAELAAREGIAKTSHLHMQMQRIEQASHTTETSMYELKRQAAGIEQMIRDIREIAEQTNMLALNAAIEAARAGAEGRGFAVVADEVRKLANRADEAASHIMDVAGAIIKKSHQTVQVVQEERQEVQSGLALVQELQTIVHVLSEKSALSATHTARNAEVMGEVLRDVDAAEQNIDKVMYISQSFSVSAKEAAAAGEAQLNATEQVSDQARRLHETSVKIHQIAERFEL
ncbi:methyl-accepting chemotaxis protein [Brevibacillus agri]|uniref:methyl-accepting chemotaxis protein n=1 Tax=Brevibacillus agri TaxID=51101 RepID=UPI002E24D781|nr:methyl-accepting chemotaxis protein [Brevibacillus agri]MED1654549.1 methyl-accepting chemotaxis protein [Brevibacillus agri]MED1686098.1 methyl-accepting chemotaxis protein [Brevibacillus agri]MED1690526.1 methyl-accepting chemotaxis protein [Brevibacillus agri]MED1695683.1 methyl-accepting chemotaxis protein [Brevibacillus agri]